MNKFFLILPSEVGGWVIFLNTNFRLTTPQPSSIWSVQMTIEGGLAWAGEGPLLIDAEELEVVEEQIAALSKGTIPVGTCNKVVAYITPV